MDKNSNSKFRQLFPYFLLAVAIIIAFKIISEITFLKTLSADVWGVVAPFIYGLIVAYIISVPGGFFTRLLAKAKLRFFRERRRGFGILIAYAIVVFIILLIVNLLLPIIYDSVMQFIANFPKYYDNFLAFIDSVNELGILETPIKVDSSGFSIEKLLRGLIADFGSDDIASTISAIMGVSSAIFTGFLTLISSVYFLAEKENIKKYLSKMLSVFLSARAHETTVKYAAKLNANFKRYLLTQAIDGLIIGALATVELTIIGSPYALNLGILLGVLNFIPYFGAIIGCVIAIIVVGFSQGLVLMLVTAGLLIATQQIDGNIIQPKLMGRSFSMSPLLLLFVIVLGGTLGGIIGMIAAIPITAVLKDLLDNYAEYYARERRRL